MLKLTKEAKEILKAYIAEINERGYSEETRTQLIELKKVELSLKKMIDDLKKDKTKTEQSLEEIKRIRKDNKYE